MKNESEHGIASASYQGGPGEPHYQATMECLCGWVSSRQVNWEDAGKQMDQHLACHVLKIGDRVMYSRGAVGQVLRVRINGEERGEWQEVYVQWPDSGYEYVKPTWEKSSRLLHATTK